MTKGKLLKLSMKDALEFFEAEYSKEMDTADQLKWFEGFDYARLLLSEPEEEKPKKAKTQFKYTCPQCEEVVKGKEDISIICGSCNHNFEMEDVEE